jgi:hypothetical protein
MRWDNLFDDLESQLEHELTAEDIDLRAEEERLRLARISLRDRVIALGGARGGTVHAEGDTVIRFLLVGGTAASVQLRSFGRDWFSGQLVDDSGRHPQCIVPLAAIAGLLMGREQVRGSLAVPETDDRSLSARLGLAFVLRDLCRRRASVELHLLDGVVRGTIDRVGRDHLDLAVHEPGSPRREIEVSHYRVVPFSRLLLVRL